jgi:plastocyanin
MNNELRERAILPVLIPVVAIIVTEIVVFSMSRVLLAAGETPAVVIGLGAALAILIGAAMIAARPRLKTASIVAVLALGGIVTIAAGVAAIQRGPAYEREEAENLPTIEVSADDLVFSTKTLELKTAGAHIDFENADTQQHNIAIFESAGDLGTPLFRGEMVEPGGSTTYEVPKQEPGTYYFHCDVHPQMNGKAVVT